MLESFARTLNVVVALTYGAAATAYLLRFLRGVERVSRSARATLVLAVATSVALATVRAVGERHVPLSSVGEALSFFALCTVVVYAWLESRTGTQAMGIFIVGIAFAFQLAGSLAGSRFVPFPPELRSHWFGIHVVGTLLAFSAFAIAAVLSTLYLLLYRELHAGRPGYIYRRIPSLEALDTMAARAVALGFVLLTMGIVTGSLWAHRVWGTYWSWDPKQCSSLTIWLVYAGYVWARWRQHWSARRVAYFAMAGFVVLVFTFVVLERVLQTAHRFS